ncbi:MAG TPA: acetyl-CoA carboxylase biotin carboxyl carrier protein [Rhodothermales bacterium]|nr:acetyl-CoA carboxylase biotin carboxyl carrier protein [Rhodothermales bacterium]
MDPEKIERLLAIIAQSGMAEVELEEGEFRLIVRAHAAPAAAPVYSPPPAPAYVPAALPPMPAAPAAPAAPPAAPATPAAPSAPTLAANEHVLVAPIIGRFYASPSPDSPAFVEVGKRVKVGDVLCIIEAMKLMNEVPCDVSGTVTRILAENGQAVEYDQPLFVIEKD